MSALSATAMSIRNQRARHTPHLHTSHNHSCMRQTHMLHKITHSRCNRQRLYQCRGEARPAPRRQQLQHAEGPVHQRPHTTRRPMRPHQQNVPRACCSLPATPPSLPACLHTTSLPAHRQAAHSACRSRHTGLRTQLALSTCAQLTGCACVRRAPQCSHHCMGMATRHLGMMS